MAALAESLPNADLQMHLLEGWGHATFEIGREADKLYNTIAHELKM